MGILFQKRNVFISIYANKGSAVSSYLESFFSWNECRIRFEGSAFSILASCCTDSQVLSSNYTKNLLRNVPNPQNWNGLLPPSRVKEIPRQPGPMVVPLSHCYLMRPPLWRSNSLNLSSEHLGGIHNGNVHATYTQKILSDRVEILKKVCVQIKYITN